MADTILSRRVFITGLAASAVPLPGNARRRAARSIGAIRWDAFYTQSSTDHIRSVVERTLGARYWHKRAPSCAVPLSENSISYDRCGIPSRIDSEILAASGAGIDYWAYGWFGSTHPMQQAWRLHQSSPYAKLVNWALIQSYAPFAKFVSNAQPELLRYLKQENYQRVLDSRPLIFLLHDKTILPALSECIGALRRACSSAHIAEPYIVLMLNGGVERNMLTSTGADAVGAYVKAGYTPVDGEYSQLVSNVEEYWDALAKTGQPVVPTAMTGWDPRPREETATPWASYPRGSAGEYRYFKPGTPSQIATHVDHMLRWIAQNAHSCPSQTGLIYSWDEHDEGGSTLNPTLGDGDRILNAVGQVLRRPR